MKKLLIKVIAPVLGCMLWLDWQLIHMDTSRERRVNAMRTDRMADLDDSGLDRAAFSLGCLWYAQASFDGAAGVVETVSGFTGGETRNPTYLTAPFGGHADSVLVYYNATTVSYTSLLARFFAYTDPFAKDGQFCDRGTAYRSVVHALTDAQQAAAEAALRVLRRDQGDGGHPLLEVTTAVRRIAAPAATPTPPKKRGGQHPHAGGDRGDAAADSSGAGDSGDDGGAAELFFFAGEEAHQFLHYKQHEKYVALREACGVDRRLRVVRPRIEAVLAFLATTLPA